MKYKAMKKKTIKSLTIKKPLSMLFLGLITSLSAVAYDGIKPLPQQDTLPEHLNTGSQIRIGHNHYLLLDQIRAIPQEESSSAKTKQPDTELLGSKGIYNIQASISSKGQPVVWNQSTQRYAILLDELGLVLNDISQAENIAGEYGLILTTRLSRLKRAYYQVDAEKIPELMRNLQQDTRVREVLPSLLENARKAM